jgi:Flp pilus assembly protein TadD
MICFRGGAFSVKQGPGKMKGVVCLGMAFALVGCVTAQEQQQMAVAVAQCHSEKTPPEWMRCLNEPDTRIAGRETLLMAYEQAQR